MVEPISEIILRRIDQAVDLYHRLIILVALAGVGKTAVLKEVSMGVKAPLINVNLELSRRMLDLTERQRALQLPILFSEIVDSVQSDVLLLDNIEILFDVLLKQDPLRLLQGLSRNKTLVVAWNGSILNEHLVYAAPDHLEYKRYSIHDLQILNMEDIA